MKTKITGCDFCGKPLDVRVGSKGPHYCNEMCEQMRSESENLNETLSIDANYVDIDELEGFAELDHTVASSQEEIARAQQEASYEEARRKNHKNLFSNLSPVDCVEIYDFSGDFKESVPRQEFLDNWKMNEIHTKVIGQYLLSLIED
jgi:uncharacterized small protein (DUF1192 family)